MTGTGLAVARTRGALASLFAATRLSRAIEHLPVLGVDTYALAYGLPDAPKEEATARGHPVAALSRFFLAGSTGLKANRPPMQEKFPRGNFFCPPVPRGHSGGASRQRFAR